ncbi:MAG: ABC transporter permease subunit, partial [Bdellovibrionia bacterium]
DILQSIPVLGFLPGLLLGLVALFPDTNLGLELAAIIMIFTGQVWNMTFSFYASIKSVPKDFKEAATVMGLSWKEKLKQVELPYSAVNLAWNSLLSMAGGWFFLIPCEAITLGDQQYRLPGIGAYMDVAVKAGDFQAVGMAVFTMILIIVSMDFVIWRPILSWVQRFRLEENPTVSSTEPLMNIWIRESQIVRWIKLKYRDFLLSSHRRSKKQVAYLEKIAVWKKFSTQFRSLQASQGLKSLCSHRNLKVFEVVIASLLFSALFTGSVKLFFVLKSLSPQVWIGLFRDMLWTFLRVIFALAFSTLWAVPVGIWIGTSSKRIRLAQPIIQVLASFPAPMLYPVVLTGLFSLGFSLNWAAMFLMLLGVQWYVLFNVLAGAMRIPRELNDALELMECSSWDKWKRLYLPSVFPSLVTGWVSASGGAWNASVVAEYLFYQGKILKADGLGADLSVATSGQNFTYFAATLTLMVFAVICFNRLVWSRLYELAQTRFRLEG